MATWHGLMVSVVFFLVVAAHSVSSTRSPFYLEFWAQTEDRIHHFLDSELRISDPRVKQYLADFNHSFSEGKLHARRAAKNPILIYQLIRRYVLYISPIQKSMAKLTSKRFFESLGGTKEEIVIKWPTIVDLDDIRLDIIRMHIAHDFDVYQFAQGNLMGEQTTSSMTPEQIKEIGEFALQKMFYSIAILWLEAALKFESSPASAKSMRNFLLNATQVHDLAWDKRSDMDYHFFEHKLSETQWPRKSMRRVLYEKYKGKQNGTAYNDINMWGLCSGDNYQTPKERSQLHCWYDTGMNNVWKINPVKAELLSKDPPITQYYEIIGERRINALKNAIIPAMVPAPKRVDRIGEFYTGTVEAGFLKNDTLGIPLARYLEKLFGMNLIGADSSDNFRVAVYSVGGFVTPHLDRVHRADQPNLEYGGRIATLIIYMSDVEKGGWTVFPVVGVAVRPLKGSAVLFHTDLRNGNVDRRSYHAGCPVVFGLKWIVTKWIRSNGQMFTKPCTLDPNQ